MHRDDSNQLAWGLLALFVLATAGMLLGSWELVLYPTVLTFGVLLALPLVRSGRRGFAVPVGVTVVLLVLFGVLHAMGLADPSGTGSFLGWDPMTAIYLFLVGPAYLSVGLFYALHDRATANDTADDTAADTDTDTAEETAR